MFPFQRAQSRLQSNLIAKNFLVIPNPISYKNVSEIFAQLLLFIFALPYLTQK